MSLTPLAITANTLCMAFVLFIADHAASHMNPPTRAQVLHQLAHVLEEDAFRYRPDIIVRVSGESAAWGFSTPGCDGVLLLTLLPETAQSWAHVLPEVSRDDYAVTYVYRGETLTEAPVRQRAVDVLVRDLSSASHESFSPSFSLLGLAEKGDCGLTERAIKQISAHLKHNRSIPHTHDNKANQ